MTANLIAKTGIITADWPGTENWQMRDPAVAALSNGNYVVAWKSEEQDTKPRHIYFQIYDADGNEVSGVQEINADPGDIRPDSPMERPQIVGLADGGFVITHSDQTEGLPSPPNDDTLTIKLKVHLFDSSGNLVSEDTPVQQGYWVSDVAALGDGGYVVVWRQSGENFVFARRYDASGNIVETSPSLATGAVGVTTTEVAGGYVVIYDTHPGGAGRAEDRCAAE